MTTGRAQVFFFLSGFVHTSPVSTFFRTPIFFGDPTNLIVSPDTCQLLDSAVPEFGIAIATKNISLASLRVSLPCEINGKEIDNYDDLDRSSIAENFVTMRGTVDPY